MRGVGAVDTRRSESDFLSTLPPAVPGLLSSREEIERICMRNLLESSDECIFFKDRESRFLLVSAGWLAAYFDGRSVDELVGKTDFDIFSEPHAAAALADEQRVIRTGRPMVAKPERETFHDRLDKWTSTSKLPLRDEAGEIIGTFGLSRDITAQVQAQDALAFQSLHDSVTGLASRVALMDRLHQAVREIAFGSDRVALLVVDVDDFKSVNDTLGHETGDRVLRELGRRLTRVSRRGDTVARLGGDEFVLLCPALAEDEDLGLIGDRAMRAICAPLRDGRHDLTVTGSLGGVITAPGSAEPEELLQQADIAMHAAKRTGGNRFEIYTPALRGPADFGRSLASELRRAIENAELFVLYQPIVDLMSGSVLGAEALVRWRHPKRGVISPDQFIPVAERRGLISAIGTFVLDDACRQLIAWTSTDGFPPSFKIGVNFSGRELRDPELVTRTAATLQRHHIAAERLVIEITENALIGELGDAHRAIESLMAIGVRIALDDFGTGYSTLAHLRQLRSHALKIDRSFIAQLAGDSRDSEIVAAVAGMGHALGMTIVAEGVETDAQRAELAAIGCDAAQGYLFARPLAPAELAALWKPADIAHTGTVETPRSPEPSARSALGR
jgi:diguanylate cyclase (GGDEF)-like protein/PAS domain S-box-containing protein